jgi:hypothetical protein
MINNICHPREMQSQRKDSISTQSVAHTNPQQYHCQEQNQKKDSFLIYKSICRSAMIIFEGSPHCIVQWLLL